MTTPNATNRPRRRMHALVLLAVLATAPATAADTIIIVTSTADIGGSCPGATCTLRNAIAYANASPALAQIIGFDIPGACPRTIKLFTPLPAITDSLSIRGYTQPGATPNSSLFANNATLCIQIQPVSEGNVASGLHFAPTDIAATFDVSGLSIGGFDYGIHINGGNYAVTGNFLGIDADGDTRRTNRYSGVMVAAGNSYTASSRVIGGPDLEDQNLISANGTGVMLATGGGNFVQNNLIGTDRSGNAALANGNGIYAASIGNNIINNLVSGNSDTAIRIEGPNGLGNAILTNRIGLKNFVACFPPPCPPANWALGNGGDGIRIANGAAGSLIADNTIGWNDGDGISLPNAAMNNGISINSMHDNVGLGIDLGADGVDANDNDAAVPPGSPNRLLNYPELVAVGGGNSGGVAHGALQSTNGHYTIEFYADTSPDPSLHGEGATPLGSGEIDISNAPPGQNGTTTFALPIAGTALVGKHISAIVRDATNCTSEFSEAHTYVYIDVIFTDGFD